MKSERRQKSIRDVLPLLERLADRSPRLQVVRLADCRSEHRMEEHDAEPQVAPTVIESIIGPKRASAHHANSHPATVARAPESRDIGRSLADALRVVIDNRHEQQFLLNAAIEAVTRERRRPPDNETARRPPVSMPAIANYGYRGENSSVDARLVDRSSAGRVPGAASPKRELVARIELDDERLAEETSTRVAEEIAAREAALVERIERLVERKLDGVSRMQVQRHRGIEAAVRMQ